ncbi:hypothetical protein ACN47E_008302 [Coniothyrium glycines]
MTTSSSSLEMPAQETSWGLKRSIHASEETPAQEPTPLHRITKRPKLSLITHQDSTERLLPMERASTPPCPPSSTPALSMRLTLQIPHPQPPSKQEQTRQKKRTASAARWTSALTRPYPTSREIREAYDLKLLRHYGANPAQASAALPFIKPAMQKSARVEKLMRAFPVTLPAVVSPSDRLLIRRPGAAAARVHDTPSTGPAQLLANQRITSSEYAQRLAWRCFATSGPGSRHDSRDAMLLSGLRSADLDTEASGRAQDQVPDWRRERMERYASAGARVRARA